MDEITYIKHFDFINDFYHIDLSDEQINLIYDLLHDKQVESVDSIVYLYRARLLCTKKDFESVEGLLLSYVDKDVTGDITNCLAYVYEQLDHEEYVDKYYKMGIEKNNIYSYINYVLYLLKNNISAKNIHLSENKFCSKNINISELVNQIIDKHNDGYYLLGIYLLDKSKEEAIKIFLKGCELGNIKCYRFMGDYYIDEDEDEHVSKKKYGCNTRPSNLGLKYYLTSIEKCNDYVSVHKVGLYYARLEDYKEMKKYYHLAITKYQYAPSMYEIGKYYLNIKKNNIKAKKYFEQAIGRYCSESMLMLGLICSNNENDNEKAEYYFRMAVNYGNNLDAYYALAMCCYKTKKYEEMIECLEYTISYNHTDSIYLMSCYYGENKKEELKQKYLIMAANQKHSGAMLALGTYHKTNGNYNEMEKYYLEAASNNESEGYNLLAEYYYKIDVRTDAIKYWYYAAQKGNQNALINMAELCMNYINYVDLGSKLYEELIFQKNVHAMRNLGLHYKKHSDTALMIYYLTMATDHNDFDSMYLLAEYYYKNKKNDEAVKYYVKIITHENKQGYQKYKDLIDTELFEICYSVEDYEKIIEYKLLDCPLNVAYLKQKAGEEDALDIVDIYKLGVEYNEECKKLETENNKIMYEPGGLESILAKHSFELSMNKN